MELQAINKRRRESLSLTEPNSMSTQEKEESRINLLDQQQAGNIQR
jgi:hypothetical protein